MNAIPRNNLLVSVLLVVALAFVGCSKSSDSGTPGGGGGGGGTTLTPTVAVGAMTKGSVKVNGVEFVTNASTTITADDNPNRLTEAILDDGKTVKVKGTVNDDGITGTALQVEVVNEARGAVTAKGADTLTVHGQTVLVDGGTVLKDAAGAVTTFATFTSGEKIEVHGGRDDLGVIHATRVQKQAGAVVDDLRGAVSGKTATTLTIGGQVFTVDGSTVIVPATATFADVAIGKLVEVQLGAGNAATQITLEDLDHPEFEAAEGQERSFEGIISGFSSTASPFSVGTQPVQLVTSATGTNPTSIVGGVLADLINGMKVEAEGHVITGGVLVATKVTIKDSIRIEANADSAGSATAVSVLGGTTLAINSGTRLSNLTGGAAIAATDGLRIRGFINRDGTTITATRIDKRTNSIQSDQFIIQGPVKAINATAHTFTIMGIPVSPAATVSARPNDDNSNDNNTQSISLDSFFSSLKDGLTIVKAKGTFSGGTLTATEIELE